MRTFKRIYYPGLAILLILSLIMTVALQNTGGGVKAVDSASAFAHAEALTALGARGQEQSANRERSRTHITAALRDGGFSEAAVNEDGFILKRTVIPLLVYALIAGVSGLLLTR